MARAPAETGRRVGTALVAAQLALILLLMAQVAGPVARGEVAIGAWALGIAGLALAGAALFFNRPGNFNIRPEPRAGGRLIRRGPYRWIRHPMYTSILACGVAAAWGAGGAAPWLELAGLAIVLFAKSTIEERAMSRVHPEYASYRASTRRFVPWVF